MKNIKTILIAVLSFMLLFSISCKNEDKTGGGSGDYDIPTVSGDPVSDFTLAVYNGDFTRTKLEVSPENSENSAMAEGVFPATYANDTAQYQAAGLSITAADKITVSAPMSTIVEAPAYKSGNDYTARVDIDNTDGNEDSATMKSYVKFTISGDTVNVTEYVVAMTIYGVNMRATYTATLTKDASQGS